MKSWQFSVIGLLAATVVLGACSKEEKPVEPAPAPIVAPVAPPAPVANEPGGYVPTEEERYHPPAADAAAPAAVEAPTATPEAAPAEATPEAAPVVAPAAGK